MKIIKFREKKHFSYKRKVLIRDLILKISVGIHGFEKKKKQRVKFNIDINADPNLVPNDNSLDSCLLYTSQSPRDAPLDRMPSCA